MQPACESSPPPSSAPRRVAGAAPRAGSPSSPARCADGAWAARGWSPRRARRHGRTPKACVGRDGEAWRASPARAWSRTSPSALRPPGRCRLGGQRCGCTPSGARRARRGRWTASATSRRRLRRWRGRRRRRTSARCSSPSAVRRRLLGRPDPVRPAARLRHRRRGREERTLVVWPVQDGGVRRIELLRSTPAARVRAALPHGRRSRRGRAGGHRPGRRGPRGMGRRGLVGP